MKFLLLLLIPSAAFAVNTCSPATVRDGTGGVDGISQYGARVSWTTNNYTVLTNHQIAYWTGSSTMPSNPNVLQLNTGATTWSGGVLGGILGGSGAPLTAGTLYYFSPFSSDTGALGSNGLFSSANVCASYVGSFTTSAAQTLAQRKPAAVRKFIPPTIPDPTTGTVSFPAITGTVWHDGVNCSTAQGCINSATGAGDGVELIAGKVYNECIYLPSNPNLVTITYVNSTTLSSGTAVFTNGQQIIFALQNGASLPVPLQIGPASDATLDPVYVVQNVSGANFGVKDNTGASVTFTTSGSGTLYALAWPTFSGTYHVLTSDAPAANLPPAGVNLDTAKYGSTLPVINNQSCFMTAGYMPTGWIVANVKITTPATGSVADPAVTPALVEMAGGHAGDHVIFDRVWFAGPARPDRLGNIGNYFGGANWGITNSVFSNEQSWIPVKQSILTASGNVISLSAGKNWYWSSAALNYSIGSTLTATITGTGAFNVYQTTSSATPVIAPGTGVTVSGATGFTVLSPASVTAGTFPLDSNSRWAVHPIGYGTVSGSTITITDMNTPSVAPCLFYSGSLGSAPGETCYNDAAAGLYLNGPGAFTDYNNRWVGATGIIGAFFDYPTQNGCGATPCQSITAQPHDIWIQRDTVGLDLNKISLQGNMPADGGYGPTRNLDELKAVYRGQETGNLLGPIITDIDPTGTCVQYPQLASSISTYATGFPWVTYQLNSDVEVSYNTLTNCAVNFEIGFNNSTQFNQFPAQRFYVHDNLMQYSLDPSSLYSGGGFGQSEAESILFATPGCWDCIFSHNTAYGRGGSQSSIDPGLYSWCNGCIWQNDIVDFTYTAGGYPDLLYNSGGADMVPLLAANGTTLISGSQGVQSNELWLPTWTTYGGGSPTSWTLGQLASYESAYSLGAGTLCIAQCTGTPNPAYTAIAAAVGWFSVPNPAQAAGSNWRLLQTSPYISGGTYHGNDGLDRGADIDALEAAQGKVSNVHPYSITSTGLTVGFLAPDGYCATVDADPSSDSGNFTPGVFTRFPNSCGNARVQNVAITGLTAHRLYTFRVNSEVSQPTITVQLP